MAGRRSRRTGSPRPAPERIESTFEPLPIDAAVAHEWDASPPPPCAPRGWPRRALDLAIAATGNVHDVPLLTRNSADFQIIHDLVDVHALEIDSRHTHHAQAPSPRKPPTGHNAMYGRRPPGRPRRLARSARPPAQRPPPDRRGRRRTQLRVLRHDRYVDSLAQRALSPSAGVSATREPRFRAGICRSSTIPRVQALAKKANVPPGELLLAWASRRGITVVIYSGSRAKQNLAVLELEISDEVLRAIDGLAGFEEGSTTSEHEEDETLGALYAAYKEATAWSVLDLLLADEKAAGLLRRVVAYIVKETDAQAVTSKLEHFYAWTQTEYLDVGGAAGAEEEFVGAAMKHQKAASDAKTKPQAEPMTQRASDFLTLAEAVVIDGKEVPVPERRRPLLEKGTRFNTDIGYYLIVDTRPQTAEELKKNRVSPLPPDPTQEQVESYEIRSMMVTIVPFDSH